MVQASAGKCSNWGGRSLAEDLCHIVCFLSPLFLKTYSQVVSRENVQKQITLENSRKQNGGSLS